MGEYEDRYPEAYGREETARQPGPREEVLHPTAPRQVRDRPVGAGEYEDRYPEAYGREETARQPAPREELQPPPRQVRDHPAGAVPGAEPSFIGRPIRGGDTYRGIGPRGYTRSPQRIYEDICDRLTDNPFIDASDIEVSVRGLEVTLSGTVENGVALRQAQQIAEEAVGVSHVHNRLAVRDRAADRREPTAGDEVNRAMPGPAR